MEDAIREKIEQLTQQINDLSRQHSGMGKQLIQLINELESIKRSVAAGVAGTSSTTPTAQAVRRTETPPAPVPKTIIPPTKPVTENTSSQPAVHNNNKGGLEAFVGGNITSKAGILVTIIGIFIGTKYSIEHNLVSPIVRIISGYLGGLVLTGIAIRLKKKYELYSAVLMGGGLSVLYFITYTAYAFYGIWPQWMAFILMLICTAATVYAALVYNRVIIAHLAQITAYALPFLLSDNSGRYAVFFSYITIINAGIMGLAFRKNWKSLFNTAFVITWIIFGTWYVVRYEERLHFFLAFAFLTVFFLLFYTTFLAYKLVKKEQYNIGSVILVLCNAFIFYALGYGLLNDHNGSERFTGLFTIVNALLHLAVCILIRRAQLADRALYYLILGLAIVFITIAIPVQFDGNWVTLLWTGEALLLFLIGRSQQAAGYEKTAAGLTVLSFMSLVHDWINHMERFNSLTTSLIPFLNIVFLTGLMVCGAQFTILYLYHHRKTTSPLPASPVNAFFYHAVLPVITGITAYGTILTEILGYFSQLNNKIQSTDGSFGLWQQEINGIGSSVWMLYTLVFITLIHLLNHYRVRNKHLAIAGIVLSLFVLLLLLVSGMPQLNEQAALYYQRHGSGMYFGMWNIGLRYITIAVTGVLLLFTGKSVPLVTAIPRLPVLWTVVLHVSIAGLLSFEYLHWAAQTGSAHQYNLGLSILWGLYALFLIVQGIRQKNKILRITAIAAFAVTLLKLFLYDLTGMSTLTKTISFISLGVILLLVSYLYNRYKEVLFGE